MMIIMIVKINVLFVKWKSFLNAGDLSGHKMWTNYSGPERVLDNIASVSGKIHSMFPNIPIFPLIGNNDLPGHYILPNSSNDWYQRLLAYWEPLILCSGCPGYAKNLTTKAVLQKSFLEGGYYNASIAGNLTIVSINFRNNSSQSKLL